MYGVQKQMVMRNKEYRDTVETEIVYNGNWNRNNEETPVYTKAIAVVTIKDIFDTNTFVFTHDEILEILDVHIKADLENIKMIKNKDINTGVITKIEKSLKEKIDEYFQTGLDAWM